MKKTLILCIGLVIVAALLCACGGQSNASSTSTTTQTQTQTQQSKPTPTPVPAKTAADIVQVLKSKGLPIGESFTFNEDNDSNKLLNRPHQYTSKVSWKDTRVTRQYVNDTGAKIEVADGGSVEVFDNATDAQARFKYIQAISTSSPMFAEWEYIEGNVILRVSNELGKTKAQAYDDALKQILAA